MTYVQREVIMSPQIHLRKTIGFRPMRGMSLNATHLAVRLHSWMPDAGVRRAPP